MIHSYTFSWNESLVLPYYIRHYSKFVDRMFFFDNGSTDNSLDIINSHKNTEIIKFDVEEVIKKYDKYNIEIKKQLDSNQCPLQVAAWLLKCLEWKERSKEADWIIISDMDEFIWHDNILKYLRRMQEDVILAEGYNMIIDPFPKTDKQLWQVCTFGRRAIGYDKFLIFKPKKITSMNYKNAGCHITYKKAWKNTPSDPIGDNIKINNNKDIKNLHFRYLGIDYLHQRYLQLYKGGIKNPRYRSSNKGNFIQQFKLSKQLPFLPYSECNKQSFERLVK